MRPAPRRRGRRHPTRWHPWPPARRRAPPRGSRGRRGPAPPCGGSPACAGARPASTPLVRARRSPPSRRAARPDRRRPRVPRRRGGATREFDAAAAVDARETPRSKGTARRAPFCSRRGLRSRLMVVRFGLLLSCVTLVVAQAHPAFAATASQTAPPPQRILLVGDSTAETLYPFLRDAAAPHGVDVESAARIGCSVIDGDPKLDDGRPYIDIYGDTSQCAAITASQQNRLLASQNPDVVIWLSEWEAWPNRVLDGQLVHFGTIPGNKAILAHIDAAVARLTAKGARLVL